MLRQLINLDGYWLVTVIYVPQERDMPMVAEAYRRIGCPEDDIRFIETLMVYQWNKGATFSNPVERRSVMVIGRSKNWEQFFNTVMHEVKHVVDDIVAAYDVMNYGEPPAYLQGEIGRQMAPMIRRIACPCCGIEG